MNDEKHFNYNRIAQAIAYIKEHAKEQPSLDSIAEKLNLSPIHFQKMFSEWVGVSPKKFLQYISIEYAKSLLKDNSSPSLFDVSEKTGLSSTSRLHDLFISIEGMTPGEYKNGGACLRINYSFSETPFGEVIIASTLKGICFLAFIENKSTGLRNLKEEFPKAAFYEEQNILQQNALSVLNDCTKTASPIKLHIKGTAFQLKVWEALLKIPVGQLSTYGAIANTIDHVKASRAVGTAIGSNPIAFLIPCHRVVQSSGALGGYMWGTTRKTLLIGWEAAKTNF